jgi:hypothetical protein
LPYFCELTISPIIRTSAIARTQGFPVPLAR